MLNLLKPTSTEIEQLALRESDPARYAEFEPITRGIIVALGIIFMVAVAGAVTAPFRLLARLIQRPAA